MKSLVLFFIVAVTAVAIAQPPDTLWTRTFGGSHDDCGQSVQLTIDGGYIITGQADFSSWTTGDIWLIKTNSNGDTLWSRTFGGGYADIGYCVQQTADGGYIIAGAWNGATDHAWLIKTDSLGNQQWARTFEGSGNDAFYSVQQTTDGGYIITGIGGDADVWLIKTDSQGDSLWTRTFGGVWYDAGGDVQQTNDGGYVIAGGTTSYGAGQGDVWLIKTDSLGNQQWNRTFGGSNDDGGNSVQQTNDGGYIITGDTRSYGAGGADVWLIKTDSLGNQQWNRTFGGDNFDRGYSVQQTNDGGYIITGKFGYSPLYDDVWLIKTDPLGIRQWQRTFGGGSMDRGYSVQQTNDGGYVIAGETASFGAGYYDVWLIRLAGTNPTLSVSPDSLTFSAEVGGANPTDQFFLIENTGGGSFDYTLSEDISWLTAAPMSGGPIPPTDTVLVSVDISGLSEGNYEGDIIVTAPGAQGSPDTVHVTLHIEASDLQLLQGIEVPKEFALLPAFPNPFNSTTLLTYCIPVSGKVTLGIYNTSGQRVTTLFNGVQSPGIHTVSWNPSDAGSGIYFCQLAAGNTIKTRKLVLLK